MLLSKKDIINQLEPGDKCLFEFKKRHHGESGWYEYISSNPCPANSQCSTFSHGDCQGYANFKGLDSKCLVFAGEFPVIKIKKFKSFSLPDELFEIKI